MPYKLWFKAFITFQALVMLSLGFARPSTAGTTTYVYDELDRLHQVWFDTNNYIEYNYDEVGNLISKTPVGTIFTTPVTTYTLNFSAGPNGTLTGTGTTTQTINANANATPVTAVPATGYQFVNWTGDNGFATTTANPLTVTNVTASRNITANFSLLTTSNLPVRISGPTPVYFSTLQDAYNAASDGATIQAAAQNFTENFTANRNITITIDGGYNNDYSANTGISTIQGAPHISSGTTKMRNFHIQSVMLSNQTPVANFSATPTSGGAPLAVNFTDASQYASSWQWDFGDGTTGTVQNPSHTYNVSGTYTARLTAANANGSTSATQTITVNAVPTGHRYWRLLSNTPGSGAAGVSISELMLYYDGAVQSLVGKTITSLGSAFDALFPLTNVNDGIAGLSNAVSLAYVPSGTFDISIDLGAQKNVTAFYIAPQGNINSVVYNTPLNLTFYYSDDGTTWTQAPTTYSSISSGFPNWNPGTYRAFNNGL